MLGIEPLAVIASAVGASSRNLDPANQGESSALPMRQTVLGKDIEVADARHVAKLLNLVGGLATDMRMLAFAQPIAVDVGQLGRNRQLVSHAIGRADRR